MKNIPLFEAPKQIDAQFSPNANLVLYQGDVSDFISTIPDKSVSLIITSPPYNLGKKYIGYSDDEANLQSSQEDSATRS